MLTPYLARVKVRKEKNLVRGVEEQEVEEVEEVRRVHFFLLTKSNSTIAMCRKQMSFCLIGIRLVS